MKTMAPILLPMFFPLILLPNASGAEGQETPASSRAPTFVRTSQTFESLGAIGVLLEDLDGDGDADAVISSMGTSLVLLNDGRARFAEARRLRSAHGLVAGDLDLDGDADLVLAPQGLGERTCELYLNQGGIRSLRRGRAVDAPGAPGRSRR